MSLYSRDTFLESVKQLALFMGNKILNFFSIILRLSELSNTINKNVEFVYDPNKKA